MKRFAVVLVLCCLSLVFSATAQRRRAVGKPVTTPAPEIPRWFNDPLAGITAEERERFNQGRVVFDKFQRFEDGLGPVFNGRACSECHIIPTVGGSGLLRTALIGTKIRGVYDPLVANGGPDLQGSALGEREKSPHIFVPELKPGNATIFALRQTMPIFGFGLVEATPDTTFIALAAAQRAKDPSTAGRVALVENLRTGTRTVGKFGVKAQHPTLHQFVAMAERNELGMTNPDFPDENCPSGNCAELRHNPRPGLNDSGDRTRQIVEFLTFLGAPPRGEIDANVIAGEKIFARLECGTCHVPALQTGEHPSAALNRVTYRPYSDFLLHDMGSLGDGIVQGDAKANEFRTAPLWGLRMKYRLLHDGSAANADEAIRKHDGQGRAAREGYLALTAKEREQLTAFVNSL